MSEDEQSSRLLSHLPNYLPIGIFSVRLTISIG